MAERIADVIRNSTFRIVVALVVLIVVLFLIFLIWLFFLRHQPVAVTEVPDKEVVLVPELVPEGVSPKTLGLVYQARKEVAETRAAAVEAARVAEEKKNATVRVVKEAINADLAGPLPRLSTEQMILLETSRGFSALHAELEEIQLQVADGVLVAVQGTVPVREVNPPAVAAPPEPEKLLELLEINQEQLVVEKEILEGTVAIREKIQELVLEDHILKAKEMVRWGIEMPTIPPPPDFTGVAKGRMVDREGQVVQTGPVYTKEIGDDLYVYVSVSGDPPAWHKVEDLVNFELLYPLTRCK